MGRSVFAFRGGTRREWFGGPAEGDLRDSGMGKGGGFVPPMGCGTTVFSLSVEPTGMFFGLAIATCLAFHASRWKVRQFGSIISQQRAACTPTWLWHWPSIEMGKFG